jgi:ParB/RepB/Spo0J family partition protein
MAIEKTLTHVPTHLIAKNPENPRLIFREEDLDVLMRSIEQVGIQVPLSVYQIKSGKYYLIDGERRWRCATKLGLKLVPVIVEPEPTPLNNILMMFNIHNVRVQWDLMALAQKVERVKELFLKENKKVLSKKELADLTGLTTATLSRCEELNLLPKKYQKIIWQELEKPRGEQKYTEDLFLEIKKSIKTIKNYVPEVAAKYKENKLIDIFYNKYKSTIVSNRVEFRNISKIARGEKVGIAREIVVNNLNEFIENPSMSISTIYNRSVADAYSERNLEKRISDVIEELNSIDIDDIDADLIPMLRNLKKTIDSILENR